jgi:two-component system chemotaxis sensor kinase CheA
MASIDDLKRTFFDECAELLQDLEGGLTEVREGSGTEDTINAVFRAVHSVKGGAGIFGLEALVEFAHTFEAVLDAMRHGDLTASTDAIDVLLASGDVLADLVGMARAGEAVPPGYGSECRANLNALLGNDGHAAAAGESEMQAEFDDIDFVPIRFDDEPSAPTDSQDVFEIVFRPTPDLFKKANEPLYILRELRKLGTLELVAETDTLPSLSDMEPDYPYIGWTGTLAGAVSLRDIEEVFEFVVGDCELSITQTAVAAPALVEVDAPALADPHPDANPVSSKPAATAGMPAGMSDHPDIAAPSEEGKGRPGGNKPAATTARIDLDKIDRVVNLVGELVIAQAQLGQVVQGLSEDASGRLFQVLEEVVHHTRELKDSVMSMRAQPVGAVFQRMPRLVRELSMKTGKKVRLEMAGENTEVDRTIIERLADPLTHIIRNSVDHGIEAPGDRVAAGKPEEGTIRLSAEHRGSRIVIEIRDDGAGINLERVLKKAREKGLVEPDAQLSDDEIANLVFLPGFSTAEAVSDISGRGVGMDVVRRNIQDLGGRIALKSERGRGMTIQLLLPLTLAVMDGMVIKVGRETYVVPMSAIVECLRPGKADVHRLLGSHGMLRLRGDLVPLVHLGDLLEIEAVARDFADGVIIITEGCEDVRFGLVVDELCGHQQVVIKSIEESYGTVPGIAAATILGNGRVAFILDTEKLSDMAAEGLPPGAMTASSRASSMTTSALN